ncbi:MAG TPA: MBL fold metallo-hydrolase [Syntrophomonadaceae bacterium]|nr:MBL fold metallo-hydrolase [Syntrophomonadaceae bacterium]
MELCKISGNTYYIPGPTNTGVFLFKDKYTLLLDTGDSNQYGRRICELLHQQGLMIKYVVNTHEHPDHCGGNLYIRENHPGSQFYSSPEAALFIKNDFLAPLYLYGGLPPDELARHFTRAKKLRVDETLPVGPAKIHEERFDILTLGGHAYGQIGVGTRDRVCFLGDALFSPEIIAKYSFPFLFSIGSQIQTLDTIAGMEYEFYVLGHADRVYDHQELHSVLQANRAALDKYLNLVLELLYQPKTREELLEEVVILDALQLDLKEYYYLLSTLGAMLAYLGQQSLVEYQIEDGRLYYYRE